MLYKISCMQFCPTMENFVAFKLVTHAHLYHFDFSETIRPQYWDPIFRAKLHIMR